jgi:hypothetical protein
VNRRPVLAGTAALAALALCATASSADATTAARPAVGKASSILSLVHVVAGGHDLRAGDIALLSSTLSGIVSSVSVTPVTADGTGYGTKSISSSDAPITVGAQGTPSALAAIAALTSPGVKIAASAVPAATATTTSLGGLSLLGLPVALNGAIGAGTSVRSAGGSIGAKTVTLKNLRLPSIADILGALGLDLSKLPVATLTTLLSKLHLVTSTVSAAQGVVDTAQANVDAATAALATKTASLTSAQSTLATATTTLTTATSAMQALLDTIPPLGDTVAQYDALLPAAQTALNTLAPGLAAAYTVFQTAQAAVTAVTTGVATAQGLVDTAQALVDSLTATLLGAVDTLLADVAAVLDSTPLVSLGSLEVSTQAVARSASKGGQSAKIVGGTLTGLKVLGTDVLATALGSSTVNLSALVGSALTTVNGTISTLTGTLSSVLSKVPGFPTLAIPAPKVGLLTKSAVTSISGGFGRASTTVTGLSIELPSVAIPTSLALPAALSLPALTGVTQVAGLLKSAPVKISLVNLTDQAAFRPAVLASGTTSGATPGTHFGDSGLPTGVVVLAMLLVSGAFVVRRRVLLGT